MGVEDPAYGFDQLELLALFLHVLECQIPFLGKGTKGCEITTKPCRVVGAGAMKHPSEWDFRCPVGMQLYKAWQAKKKGTKP